MTKVIEYRLPWPPSANRIWRAVAGRVILSAEGRAYAKKVSNALPAGPVVTFASRLRVTYWLYAPDSYGSRAWDIANREKVLSDALTKCGVWKDDSQIDGMQVLRAHRAGNGHVIVRIEELE